MTWKLHVKYTVDKNIYTINKRTNYTDQEKFIFVVLHDFFLNFLLLFLLAKNFILSRNLKYEGKTLFS